MDVLEKTMLVNELKQLIAGLDNDKKHCMKRQKLNNALKTFAQHVMTQFFKIN